MNTLLASIMFGFGVGGFIWVKVGRRTGQADPKSVYLTAGLAGFAAFVILYTMMKLVFGIS